MLVPLIMGLTVAAWEQAPAPRWHLVWGVVLGAYLIANILPQFPVFQVLRDTGLAMYGSLLLWAVGVVVLWKGSWARMAETVGMPEPISSAA
jgi:hypothetical protein